MNNDFNQNTNSFTNNGSNMDNQQFNNVNFQNNGANNNQVQGNEGVNQNNAQVSNNMNNYNNQSQGRNFNNYNQPNNEPQNKTSTVNYSGQIHSNKNPIDNKKILKIIIGVVVAIIIVFTLSKLLGGASGDGTKELSKKASDYDKVCTLVQDYQGQANVSITFGLYQKENQVFQDTVIIWESKNGKINVPNGKTKEEVVSTFATITGMMISFDGGTKSNVKNYYKDGKVYLTNTRTYNTNEFSNVDMLAEDIISAGATCK